MMRGRWRAGFGRTYLASCLTHRVRARRRVLDDRLERHLRSGARRLPRRARPTGISVSKTLGARLANRDVIGRATHAPFEGQATGRRVPSARALRPASVSILRARPVGGTQECEPREKDDRETRMRAKQNTWPISAFSSPFGAKRNREIQANIPAVKSVPHAANVKSRLKMR
jgi:hypothetical protein